MQLSALELFLGATATYGLFIVCRLLIARRPGDYIAPVYPTPWLLIVAPVWPPKGWIGNHWSHWIPYETAGRTIMSLIYPPTAKRIVWVGDAATTKMIMNDRYTFVKSIATYKMITFYGQNIVASEGDEWVRHRSVARASFSEKSNTLLWSETISTLNEWFADWDDSILAGDGRTTVNVTESLKELTLFIIASTGFGIHFQRSSHGLPAPGYHMSFSEALFTALHTFAIKAVVPRWMYALPINKLRQSDRAYTEVRSYIREMISAARQGVYEEKTSAPEAADLFRRLVAANEQDEAGRLSDDELISNIFVFFFGGHESSAHTLTFALALLAIYPEAQEKVVKEATQVWPDVAGDEWTDSTLAEFNRLEYTLAVFRETLRLFPPIIRILRWTTRDVTLPCETRNEMTGQWQPDSVHVEAGLPVTCNIHAVHMSPRYWGEDVAEFRPERFIDTVDYQWPRDAWFPFTAGPRVCIGQRFAMVESVCILARLLRKYRVSPPADIAKLSRREQWEKLTKWQARATATPGKVPLVFEHRAR